VAVACAGRSAPIVRALERHLVFHALKQSALFPPDPDFYLRYNERDVEALRELDFLGVFPELLPRTEPILRHFGLQSPLIDQLDLEPDRSAPAADARCYLPFFEGSKVLLVCSFADLLRQRADETTFEAVWAKTGKRWFRPAAVEALEFPYGYTASTHQLYSSSLELLARIEDEMQRREFDLALIAAAGLGAPLAAHAKRLGKIGIHLGGHLQVLFGVLGQRWRAWPDWCQRYVTSAWIDMPARYRPSERDVADGGAYW
jgi:hypothetical protein